MWRGERVSILDRIWQMIGTGSVRSLTISGYGTLVVGLLVYKIQCLQKEFNAFGVFQYFVLIRKPVTYRGSFLLFCTFVTYGMSLGEGDISAPPEGVLQVLPGHAGAQVLHLQPATL